MKIYDIPQGTKITINLVYKRTHYTVEATILTKYGNGILITPLFCGGGLIDICTNAHFEYEDPYSGRKHIFQADSISWVDFSGADFHVIDGREVVVNSENQRKAERYMVQIMGNAVFNGDVFRSVIVHDISMRGFSLMVGKHSNVSVGDKIKLEFSKSEYSTKMVLEGVVVRNFLIGGYEAVGCEIETISPAVMSFIMEKKEEHNKKKEEFAECDALGSSFGK